MRWLFIICTLLLTLPTFAEELFFSADVTTADGQATPVLTWDTIPLADDCIASGDWTGAKGGAGTETLAPIVSSATYNLICTWPNNQAELSWTAPTQNTDGSAYTDQDGYRINYAPSNLLDPASLTAVLDIASPATIEITIPGLSSGSWTFVIRARNQRGVLSNYSNLANKTVADAERTASVGIVINPVPNAPTGFSVN